LTLTIEPVDLGELVTRTLDSFRSRAHASQISLEYENVNGGRSMTVVGDRVRLSQVATNLFDNALRHTPPGGTVTVDMTAEGATVRWSVTDTGEGIASADLPHIFDRFYRADGSRSRATGGSGLGLTIVRQIITAHNGLIDVSSPPAGAVQGTRFTVTLPAG
jgi:signal transduction histidine kinase